MAKLLHTLLRHSLFRRKSNLLSLDDPYPTMQRLLGEHPVRGIIDAGASNGHVSRRLIQRFPHARSYLFEPNPAYADTLASLAREDARFIPVPKALSSSEGQMTLHVAARAGRSSLFMPHENTLRDISAPGKMQEVQVPVVMIDRWKQRENIGPIDLFKLDIQAGELEALRGADQTLRDEVSLVFTEAFFNPRYQGGALLGQIDAFLRERDFDLFNIYSPRANAQGMLQWANVLYVNTRRVKL